MLESRDVLTARYKRTHEREPNAAKCKAIGAHLLQGRQYWESAAQSGDLIRPLLLYYGTLSFCRALTLFSRRNGGEETLSKSHGLSTGEWGEEFMAKGLSAVLDFKLKTSAGTITQLAQYTHNAELSQYGVPLGARTFIRRGTSESIAGVTVTVREIIRRIPEMAVTFERLTGQRAAVYPARMTAMDGKQIDLELLQNPQGPELWTSLRADLLIPDDVSIEENVRAFYDAVPCSRIRPAWERGQWIFSRMALDESGESWAIGPFSDGQEWSQLVTMFALAYCLGMLVRYYPTLWLALSSQSPGDVVSPLLREARIIVEQHIPRLIFEQFEFQTAYGSRLSAPMS
jgi:hypothetical protein